MKCIHGRDFVFIFSPFTQFPAQVNHIAQGKSSLHLAVIRGYHSIIKLLLEYNADVNIKVRKREMGGICIV